VRSARDAGRHPETARPETDWFEESGRVQMVHLEVVVTHPEDERVTATGSARTQGKTASGESAEGTS
jgi:hypothetical protein